MKPTYQKIVSSAELKELCGLWKRKEDAIVFTNGCFDLLHVGHIDYLEKAKELGKRLVVAINSDDSVRRLKGAERPLNAERDRLRLVAALGFVDAVVLFDEDTPERLIEGILPDVLVKGSDYSIDNIAGAEIVMKAGGSVQTIELVSGVSTSGLIEKIRAFNR